MAVTISLRFATAVLCALFLFIATAIVLGITWSFSIAAVRKVGLAHVVTLASASHGKVLPFFQRPTDAALIVQQRVAFSSDVAPSLGTAFMSVNASLATWESLNLGIADLFNMTTHFVVMGFPDGAYLSFFTIPESTEVFGVLRNYPRPIGVPAFRLYSIRNATTGEVLESEEGADPYEHRTRPWFVQANKTFADVVWQTYLSFSPTAMSTSVAASLINRNGDFVGVFLMALSLTSINGMLASLPRTSGTQLVLLDENNIIVGSSVLSAPPITETNITDSYNGTIGKDCLKSATGAHRAIIACRTLFADYAGWPAAPKIARGAAAVIATGLSQAAHALVDVGGSNYYVAAVPLRTRYPSGVEVRGLRQVLVVAMPEEDVIGDVVDGRNVAIAVAACVFVALAGMMVGLVTILMRPVQAIARLMSRAAVVVDDAPLPSKSRFSEVRDIEESYDRMRKELNQLMRFVPETVLAEDEGDTRGSPNGDLSPFDAPLSTSPMAISMHSAPRAISYGSDVGATKPPSPALRRTSGASGGALHIPDTASEDSIGGADSREMGPRSPELAQKRLSQQRLSDSDASSPRALVVSRRVLAAEENVFKARVATLLFVSCPDFPTQSKEQIGDAVRAVLDVVLDSAKKNCGVIESMDPAGVLLSFNAHTVCQMHQDGAARVALAIQHALPPSYCTAADTSTCFVGTVGAQGRNARVVIGEAVDVVKRLPSLMRSFLETNVLFTERCARNVTCVPMTATDKIAPTWTQPGRAEELVVCVFDGDATVRTGGAADAFKEAFGLLSCGKHAAAEEVALAALGSRPTSSPHRDEARLQRLLVACRDAALAQRERRRCERHCDVSAALPLGYRRDEAPAWQRAGQMPRVLAVDTRAVDASVQAAKAMVVGVAQAAQTGGSAIDESALFGMVTMDEPSTTVDAANALLGSRNDADVITAANGMVWTRSRKPVGGGSFAKVYQGLSETGATCAIKAIDLTNRHLDLVSLAAEVDICSQVRHANIVSYVSCAHDADLFYILMEYVPGGSLRSLLDAYGTLSVAVVRRFAVAILHGLQHLHAHGIVHCDLKPHNVLFGSDGTIKLTDFGSSVQLVALETQRSSSQPAETIVVRGTSWYVAPEVARGEVPTAASDMWSFAITVLELLVGQVPWSPDQRCGNKESLFMRALSTDVRIVPVLPGGLPHDLSGMLAACLQHDAAARPTASDVLATFLAM